MRIYVPAPDERVQFAHPINPKDFESINALVNGEPRRDSWISPEFELVDQDEGLTLNAVDAPWLGSHALIFKPVAVLALRSVFEAYGEFLPLACTSSKLWVFNPTRVLQALDLLSSEVVRFSRGRIMHVTRYAFIPEQIAECDIFKIPDLRVSPTFVSEKIVNLFREHALSGLSFTQVWESEPDAA